MTAAAAEQKRQSDPFHAKPQTEPFHRKYTWFSLQKGNTPFMFSWVCNLRTDEPIHLFCTCGEGRTITLIVS